jgi:hypothetical protein
MVKLIDALAVAGSVAGLVGVAVGVAGFWVTIAAVLRSKAAATQARDAADRAYRSVTSIDSVGELASAISRLEDLRRLHRQLDWEGALALYGTIRKSLVTVRAALTDLAEEDKETLQGAIMSLRNMESAVERQQGEGSPLRPEAMNRELLDVTEGLQALSVAVKRHAGGGR